MSVGSVMPSQSDRPGQKRLCSGSLELSVPDKMMTKPSIKPTVLAATLVAGIASLLLVPAGYAWMASIAGLILLFTLFSFDDESYRTILQSLTYAAVCAFCLSVAAIIPYQYVYGLPTPREPQLVNRWIPLTCAFATLLFWVIDRTRMSSRITRPGAGTAAVGTMFSPAPTVQPSPQTPQHESAAVPVAPAPLMTTVRSEPAAPHLVRSEPQMPIPPAPVQSPKLADIYVRLTGEGLNLMRTVQAEPLGRDYYRIVDTMPETETWEFTPGMVVRCKKQNLSTGKAMVATEEAQRSS